MTYFFQDGVNARPPTASATNLDVPVLSLPMPAVLRVAGILDLAQNVSAL